MTANVIRVILDAVFKITINGYIGKYSTFLQLNEAIGYPVYKEENLEHD